MAKKEKRLTDKEQAFVDSYAGDAGHAAKAAGYSGSIETLRSTGCRVLQKEHIQEALKQRDPASTSKRRIMSRNKILENLSDIADNELTSDRDRIAALEKLAKANGMFTEKIITANFNANVSMDQFTDDQLNNLMGSTLLQMITDGVLSIGQVRQLQDSMKDGDEIGTRKMLSQFTDGEIIDVEEEFKPNPESHTKYLT